MTHTHTKVSQLQTEREMPVTHTQRRSMTQREKCQSKPKKTAEDHTELSEKRWLDGELAFGIEGV